MKNEIAVIIPALNEEKSIELVIGAIPAKLSSKVIVVDNGSTDETSKRALKKGAMVIREPEQGYGRACMAGINFLKEDPPSIVVFLDAGYSDDPSKMTDLVRPIIERRADLVLGSRLSKGRSRGQLPIHVYSANRVFSWLINQLYHLNLTDLGPFRAISWKALKSLRMGANTFGWSAEMIVKAAKLGLKITEYPIGHSKRIGKSKISGSVRRSLMAALYILYYVLRYSL